VETPGIVILGITRSFLSMLSRPLPIKDFNRIRSLHSLPMFVVEKDYLKIEPSLLFTNIQTLNQSIYAG
jgi:hypothetical protein